MENLDTAFAKLLAETVWENSERITILRQPNARAAPLRRFLVYVVGPLARNAELAEADGPFDIAMRCYHKRDAVNTLSLKAGYLLTGGRSKFHSAAQFLAQTGVLDRYEGFLFLDGDVEFSPGGLSEFFNAVSCYRFDMAQAALSVGSFSSWPTTLARPLFDARETSFVEVMAPYFSRAALKEVLPTFSQSISSYGLDLAWSRILSEYKIGIIDRVVMHHPQEIDRKNGPFYRYLASLGIDPMEEQRRMCERYGVPDDWRPYDIAGYVRSDLAENEVKRVPLLRLGRRLVRFSRYQDRAALLAARAFGLEETVRLPGVRTL